MLPESSVPLIVQHSVLVPTLNRAPSIVAVGATYSTWPLRIGPPLGLRSPGSMGIRSHQAPCSELQRGRPHG